MTPEIQHAALRLTKVSTRPEYLEARSDLIKTMADHERQLILAAEKERGY